MVEKWEHEAPAPWTTARCLEEQTETYPHVIVYDFESYQDKTKAACPTQDLSFESEHIPISVSIADTLNPEPEYIVAKDPNELIHLFYQSLERRHAAIVADVEERYFPPDPEGFPTPHGNIIMSWINQVPVVGFNSGHYDLKLIRKYFVPVMTQDHGIFAAEKNSRIMFINTPKFKFLDVMNYLAPGITYDKWVKTSYRYRQTSYRQTSYRYRQDKATKNLYFYSFLPRTLRQWNNLPADIVESNSLSQFQSKLSDHLSHV